MNVISTTQLENENRPGAKEFKFFNAYSILTALVCIHPYGIALAFIGWLICGWFIIKMFMVERIGLAIASLIIWLIIIPIASAIIGAFGLGIFGGTL